MQEVSALAQVVSQRRDRKKRQTRDALMQAALTLFSAKGYEHTAIREITDAVDVSERTFFRYFASKEDLALSFARSTTEALLRELAARPAAEPPLAALRNALHISVTSLCTGPADAAGLSFDLAVLMWLVDATPSLLAAHLRLMHDSDEEIARLLAQREGVNETDLRPRCAAAVFNGILITAHMEWQAKGGGAETMLAIFDAYADQVLAALSGHWS